MTSTTTNPTALEQAARLGKLAFLSDKKRVPALDRELMSLIGQNDGHAVNLIKAWNHAFDKANLSAPVPVWGEIVSSYSRAQAIDDGELVDVSKVAREAGIRFPVALTKAVHSAYVKVPEGVSCQDEAGRLWDIIFLFQAAAKKTFGSTFTFQLSVRNHNRELGPKDVVTLKAICGPGDDPRPVITISLPEED